MNNCIVYFIILVGFVWIFWVMYMIFFNKRKIDKKYYKIVTDGKIFRIKFPSGYVGCSDYLSVQGVKQAIDLFYKEDLKRIEDKKKKWKEVNV